MIRSKKYLLNSLVPIKKEYSLIEAIKILKNFIQLQTFNESIELHIALNKNTTLEKDKLEGYFNLPYLSNKLKETKCYYKFDKTLSAHILIGKLNMSELKIYKNIIEALKNFKFNINKETTKSIYICSTMSPSFKLNPACYNKYK